MLAGKQSETERYFEAISKRVAKLAVAALHKLSKPKKELEGKVKSGSKSKSVLEKIRERRSVNDEIEAPLSNTDIFKKSKLNPNYKLARQLRLGSDQSVTLLTIRSYLVYHFKTYLFTESTERDFLQESKRGKLTDDLVTKAGFQNHIPILTLKETYQSVSL